MNMSIDAYVYISRVFFAEVDRVKARIGESNPAQELDKEILEVFKFIENDFDRNYGVTYDKSDFT